MGDLYLPVIDGQPIGTPAKGVVYKRLKDMGDGTWAEIVSAGLAVESIEIGKVDQGAKGTDPWPFTPPAPSSSAQIAAGTTTGQTKTITTPAGLTRLMVVLSTTTASAGNTVQVTINGLSVSGFVVPLLVGLAVAAVAVTPYRVGIGFTPSPNAVANDVLPPTFQVVTSVVGTVAYGVDIILAP